MNLLPTMLAAGISAAVLGCSPSSSGGSASRNAQHVGDGVADNAFSVNPSDMTIRQGETIREIIGIKRGSIFDQEIALAFENLPPGLTMNTVKPVISSNESGLRVSWSASDGIAPGTYQVRVIGHPATGADASDHFQVTVLKKDTFTLNMPHGRNVLKRGETRAFAIEVVGEKQFAEDVTVSFPDLPKGVTFPAGMLVINYGIHEAEVSLHAESTAALGNFVIPVVGHPRKGLDAVHIFKLSIVEQ